VCLIQKDEPDQTLNEQDFDQDQAQKRQLEPDNLPSAMELMPVAPAEDPAAETKR